MVQKFLKVDSGLFGTGIKATPLEGAEFAAKTQRGKILWWIS